MTLSIDDPSFRLQAKGANNVVWAHFAQRGSRLFLEPSPRMRTVGVFCTLLIAAVFAAAIWAMWRFIPDLGSMLWIILAIGVAAVGANLAIVLWAYPWQRRRGPWVEIDLTTREIGGRDLRRRWPLDGVDELVLLTGWRQLSSNHHTWMHDFLVVVDGVPHLARTQSIRMHKHVRRLVETAGLPYRHIRVRKNGNKLLDRFDPPRRRF